MENINSQLNSNNMLSEEDTFKFECHPKVECFTRCCRNPDMYLYPYDIIQMKNRLGITSEQFLEQHTVSAIRDNPYFPNIMLKMQDDEEKSCPFLCSEGCGIYEDRPFSCRAYPLERAVARTGVENKRADCYFIAMHSHCSGHKESREWTVGEWIENQQIRLYNDMNDLWVGIDSIFRRNPWGEKGISSPAFNMAFMACFNMDNFKSFIFESTFLSRFDVSKERIDKIKESDAELMKFGFDWVKFFLTNTGPLSKSV